ncbi:MAG: SMP-30/gluconolactonase/LRE family protein [Gemmatimonadota bacterium]|nr:SMP-30/gluconolactonase/LRE family protein [Gemmatimonadota bacterium]
MRQRLRVGLLLAMILLAGYAFLWPVPVSPTAWTAPPDPGYAGPFEADSSLSRLERLSIGPFSGPEGVAHDRAGRIYVSTREGAIVRLSAEGEHPEVFARTNGRPLGLAFDTAGTLFVADGARGLLAIDAAGAVRLLADSVDGAPISFADDLDIADDGRVYFSDASSKFGLLARAEEGASVLDIIEHGGHGRLLEYDPATRRTTVLRRGLDFANGVALAFDQRSVLLSETGAYRIVRIWRDGPRRGEQEPVIEALPGFPDNIKRGRDGRYWVALFAPRNALLDRLAAWPTLRQMLLRIPSALRPEAQEYGHIIAIDESGTVRDDRHDPTGAYPKMTSVLETERNLYIGSVSAPVLARVPARIPAGAPAPLTPALPR